MARTGELETARIRDLLERAPVPIWINHRGSVAYVNLAGVELLGAASADQIIGRDVFTFIHPDFHAVASARIAALKAGELVLPLEEAFLTIDGRRLDVEVTAWTIPFAGERAIQASFTDLTLRRGAVETVMESEERLRVALAASGTGTFRWDLATGTISGDENLRELLGFSEGITDFSVDFLLARVLTEDRAAVETHLQQYAAEGTDFGLQFRVLWSDGSIHWLDVSGKTVGGRHGTPRFVTGACFDVTARQQMQQILIDRAELAALTADVGLALVEGETLPEILQRCAASIVQHLDAAFARIWTLNEFENVLEMQASAGLYSHLNGPHARVPVGKYKIGLIAAERTPHLTNDVENDPRVGDHAWAKREKMVSFAGYPLIVEGQLIGVVAMFARHPLDAHVLDALAAIANGIALGIHSPRPESASG